VEGGRYSAFSGDAGLSSNQGLPLPSFPGFVYQRAYLSADKKRVEVAVRPRKGSSALCSRCHLAAPGYDKFSERRFEFIEALTSR
jgi:hypothetical protein